MFHVGQLVVCVDDSFDTARRLFPEGYSFTGGMDGLTRGRVYTVRDVGVDIRYAVPVIFLEEINRIAGTGFAQCRFRPVSKRSTDLLRSMLTDLPSYAEVASSSRPRLPAA